jgi:sulfate adenylyltransferase subunit 1 (EFTu-like GTPase family)
MNATHRSPSSDRSRRRARETAPPIAVSPRDDASRRLVRSIDATLVWLDDAPLATASTWLVALGERTVRAHFAAMARADDLASPLVDASDRVPKHAWTRVRLTLHEPLALEAGASSAGPLTFVVVDDATHRAVAAGTVDA